MHILTAALNQVCVVRTFHRIQSKIVMCRVFVAENIISKWERFMIWCWDLWAVILSMCPLERSYCKVRWNVQNNQPQKMMWHGHKSGASLHHTEGTPLWEAQTRGIPNSTHHLPCLQKPLPQHFCFCGTQHHGAYCCLAASASLGFSHILFHGSAQCILHLPIMRSGIHSHNFRVYTGNILFNILCFCKPHCICILGYRRSIIQPCSDQSL